MPKQKIELPGWHKQKYIAEVLELDPAYLSRMLSGKEYITEENAIKLRVYFSQVSKDAMKTIRIFRDLCPHYDTEEKVLAFGEKYDAIEKEIEKRFALLQQKL